MFISLSYWFILYSSSNSLYELLVTTLYFFFFCTFLPIFFKVFGIIKELVFSQSARQIMKSKLLTQLLALSEIKRLHYQICIFFLFNFYPFYHTISPSFLIVLFVIIVIKMDKFTDSKLRINHRHALPANILIISFPI